MELTLYVFAHKDVINFTALLCGNVITINLCMQGMCSFLNDLFKIVLLAVSCVCKKSFLNGLEPDKQFSLVNFMLVWLLGRLLIARIV